MPAKGQQSSEETRQRVRASHWTRTLNAEDREKVISGLRSKREAQGHPALLARGITPDQAAEADAKGLKWCSGECKSFLPKADFGTHKARNGWCRKCWAAYMREQRAKWTPERRSEHARKRVLEKYGVTPDWWTEKLAEQNGLCALCGLAPDGRGVGRPHTHKVTGPLFCVDHSHTTGKARGLLCFKCNTSLERFESVPDWALRAIAYLARYS